MLKTPQYIFKDMCMPARQLNLFSIFYSSRLFAEFELCYVSAMVNVKTPHEFEAQQLICVLFSESLRRALKQNLLTQEQVSV